MDALRGIAIVLMVIFHFSYDLRFFGWVDWNVPNGHKWWQFRYLILSLFIFTLGMSLGLAYGEKIQWRKFGFRLAQIIAGASLVTIMSLVMFPQTWIYFGILQFLAFATLVGITLVRVPMLAMITGLLILMLYATGKLSQTWPFDVLGLYGQWLPLNTEDYVPIFPWLGVALLGVSARLWMPFGFLERLIPQAPGWLSWLGRHGLVVYLIHQPLMFAFLYPLSLLLR